MKLKICTTFYNEWDQDPLTGVVAKSATPLPIEKSLYYLRKKMEFTWTRVRSTYIAHGRNALVNMNQCRKKWQEPAEDFTHYLYIDSDVSDFEHGQVEKLIAHDLPIVSGAYTDRKNQDCFVAGNFPTVFGEPGLMEPKTTTGLIKKDWVGAGFLLIKREVFCKMPYPWFYFGHFQMMNEQGEEIVIEEPEDISFCRAAKESGFDVWLDCDCQVRHNIAQVRKQSLSEAAISAWQIRLCTMLTAAQNEINGMSEMMRNK